MTRADIVIRVLQKSGELLVPSGMQNVQEQIGGIRTDLGETNRRLATITDTMNKAMSRDRQAWLPYLIGGLAVIGTTSHVIGTVQRAKQRTKEEAQLEQMRALVVEARKSRKLQEEELASQQDTPQDQKGGSNEPVAQSRR